MRTDTQNVSIIVPTLREAGNIAHLIRRTAQTMAASGSRWELIVSDDGSEDTTVEEARNTGAGLPVRVIVRNGGKPDLAANVLRGIDSARHDTLVVMDADLSHRPEDIPRLIAALDAQTDIAIGSRYADEAAIDSAWPVARRWGSRWATAAARNFWRCSDPLSGFFAVRRSTIPPRSTLRAIGYKIGLEIAVRGNLRTREVPIRFEQRHAGTSKMNAREVLRFARHLARMSRTRWPHATQLAIFGAVGASGFVIDVATYLALNGAGVDHRVARTIAFAPAATWNWALNRTITFAERIRTPRTRQWTRAIATNAASAMVNIGTYLSATHLFTWFDTHRIAALVLGLGLGAAMNYWLAHTWVYASPRNANGNRDGSRPLRGSNAQRNAGTSPDRSRTLAGRVT